MTQTEWALLMREAKHQRKPEERGNGGFAERAAPPAKTWWAVLLGWLR